MGVSPLVTVSSCRRRLQEWREARGISYKRPPMPVKPRGARRTAGPPQPYWACMEQEEETQALVHAVDRSLDDCITLLLEVPVAAWPIRHSPVQMFLFYTIFILRLALLTHNVAGLLLDELMFVCITFT